MSQNTEDSFKVPTGTVKTTVKSDNKDENLEDEGRRPSNPSAPQCPYSEPKWSQKPDSTLVYNFEVLKSGTIIEKVHNLQEKPYWVFGRLPNCDIVLAHPTISRFHAVLQYRPKISPESETTQQQASDKIFNPGWYIFDMGSTHGTFLNKMRIPPKTYIQVKVGHMVKLGASTRNFLLVGPEFDEEPESELSVTELKELRQKREEIQRKEREMQELQREKEGIDWGMAEDADEETDLTVNPYATTNNEELFLEDPKKTLRGFFEREGLDLEYKVDEMSSGTFICRVELPIDDTNGKPLVAEVCHKGKKKECVIQCALEACRILDRHGVLRQSHHEPLKRKVPTADSDDDDDFLDRTGDIERKKLRKAAAAQNSVLTYDDLLKQEEDILEKISKVDEDISKYQELSKRSKQSMGSEEDDLDEFMTNLSEDSKFDKTEIRKLRVEQQRLKTEHLKLQRLLKIAKPVNLPSISGATSSELTKKKSLLPLFGKRNKTKLVIPRTESKTKYIEKDLRSDEEEMEEDDDLKHSETIEQKTTKDDEKLPDSNCNDDKDLIGIDSSKHVCETKQIEDSVENESKRIIGPSFIPPNILRSSTEDDYDDANLKEIQKTDADELIDGSGENSEDLTAVSKKRRSRIRVRTKGRDNVDIDDSVETNDIEKYSGWVPPENQTGDGMTSLNEKFGY